MKTQTGKNEFKSENESIPMVVVAAEITATSIVSSVPSSMTSATSSASVITPVLVVTSARPSLIFSVTPPAVISILIASLSHPTISTSVVVIVVGSHLLIAIITGALEAWRSSWRWPIVILIVHTIGRPPETLVRPSLEILIEVRWPLEVGSSHVIAVVTSRWPHIVSHVIVAHVIVSTRRTEIAIRSKVIVILHRWSEISIVAWWRRSTEIGRRTGKVRIHHLLGRALLLLLHILRRRWTTVRAGHGRGRGSRGRP